MSRPLSSKNLIWIDCEMTGLHPYLRPADLAADKPFQPDVILEIAAIATNEDLEPLDEGVEYIVKTDKAILDGMHEWCVNQHGKTGLTKACLDSTTDLSAVDSLVAAYVSKHFPPDTPAILAGSSVHADAAFIRKDLPLLASKLHYRIVDVSSIKELASRWYVGVKTPRKEESRHRAMSDIYDSIAELKAYREQIFIKEKEVKEASAPVSNTTSKS